ncbi:MAG: DUF2157 domain-containing protein [Planctomycetota bacterium]
MDLFGLGGRAFRARLKRELPRWRQGGILDEGAARTLAARYHLDEEGVSAAAAAIYTLGVLLVGGGVLSFVAWNWADISTPFKLLLITGALVAAHGTGWWLWRVSGRLPRLGHALVLLGTLIFGADVGLVSQIFHISTDPSAGFGIWAVGAAVAAWVLPSVPHGVLAVVLTSIWGSIFVEEHHALHFLVPYLVAVPFLPLAWRTSSRPLFLATALGTLWCMDFAAGSETEEGAAVLVALVLGAALLLGLALGGVGEGARLRVSGISRVVGLVVLAGAAYTCSFRGVAEDLALADLEGRPASWLVFGLPAAAGAAALFVVAVRRQGGELRSRPASVIAFAGCFLLPLSLAVPGAGTAGAVAGNLVLAALSIAAVTSSVRTLERGPFWWGALLGGLLILSRFLEYKTELWLKALVFSACGIVVILFGRTFERRREAARERGRG